MAGRVSFGSDLHTDVESPADEDGVHDSFCQLIEEQCYGRHDDGMEMTPLDPDVEDESRDDVVYLDGPARNWSESLSDAPQHFPHSARPSIRGYGVETDGAGFQEEENKRERLVNNLQNLSVSDRVRMLRAMPLSLAEKKELRMLVLNKGEHSLSENQIPCCSQLKYYIINAVRHGWYSWLSLVSSLQLWQTALKCVSGRFGTGVLSYFVFLRTLLFFNIFLFLFTALFLAVPQAVLPPAQDTHTNNTSRRSSWGLEVLTGAGYFSDSVLYYGYYSNQTLQSGRRCSQSSNGTSCDATFSYNMPLVYFFTIGAAFFIFMLLDTFFGEFLWRLFSQKALKRKRKPVFDIARNVLELIYGQTLAWLGVLFSPLLPVVQIIKLLFLFYMKKVSLMMNCQVSGKPWRASQMTTIFITLLCFPSFLGAAVCVTYTMWTMKPSSGCGPFRGLKTMFQAGKLWVRDLALANPSLWWLESAHTYLVENPLFLFLSAAVFLIVIYFHSQVLDGQRKIIELLQEQIENEGEDKKFLIMRLQDIHERRRVRSPRRGQRDTEGSSFS
ncbi:transmembrane channel-like protein 6b [Danio rerio]|uniref:Transmembrane channel-like protein n=1 Tax=Danio rerio TaxID=7955 RepID=Q6DH78_DANRE|nr:transmembrane channel-like protein 6b [Danio rerio]AAH76101.1 Zgc:92610 [Danio rerio]|eukprot:NP_001002705.1 transmembrane channel-like protein 6 [Danio rerio]